MTNELVRMQNVLYEYKDGVKHIMRADGYEGLIIDGVDVLEGKKASRVCYDYRPFRDVLYSYNSNNGNMHCAVFPEGIELIDYRNNHHPSQLIVNGVDVIEGKNLYDSSLHNYCSNHDFEFQDKDGKTYGVTLPREFKIEELQTTIIE